MVNVTFFFVSCPAKHLFDIQRLDSAFLKYSFAPARLMGSDKPCCSILFHGHLFLLFLLFGQTSLEKNSLPTTTIPSFSSIPKRYLFAPNHFFHRYQKRYQNQRNQVFLRYQNDTFLPQTTFLHRYQKR